MKKSNQSRECEIGMVGVCVCVCVGCGGVIARVLMRTGGWMSVSVCVFSNKRSEEGKEDAGVRREKREEEEEDY